MTKRVCALISVVLFSLILVAGAGAQTTNQAAIDQALSAMQGGTGGTQGLSGSLTGTAPTVAPQQPTVSQLTAAPSPSGQGSGAQTSGGAAQVPAQAVQLSPIEQMFAITASSLGTPAQNLEQFGYSLFQNPATPSLASIGDDYTLGPGDGLVLYLWGDPVDIKELSSSYVLTVDRNGSIFLPAVGQVSVWGQNLSSVKAMLKSMLDRRYKKLEMNLTLSTLRQFPVFVSGYAGAPGTVLANGADTVFTVLSRAGGILKAGSLRSVTLTRQGKGEAAERIEIDFYASLLEGKPIDLRVREGDSIFIPAIGPVVALAGELKRPGIYEIKDEATTGQVLGLAGGLLPSARSKSVSLLRFEAAGKVLRTGDIADKAFAGQAVSDGDFLYFGRVSDLLLGQAQISGAVKYPGRYEVGSFRTLKSLLLKAQPLPETNLYYGRLYRIDQSGRDRSFAFSPRDVLNSADEVPLFEFDKVVLYRYDDTGIDPDFDRFADTLVVRGPVKYPGFYLYKEGMQLSELLSHNELLLDANHMYAELIRRTANGKYEYFTFAPDSVLSGKTDMALARYDTVNFVKKGEQANNHDFDKFPNTVSLTGQVARPEVYALRPGMKLSDIVTAEQVLLDTNMNYGEMVRLRVDGKNEYETFRPKEVLEGKYDIALGARDVIRLVKVGYVASAEDVERYKRLVTVEGPVTFGGTYAWVEGMKLSELLGLAKPKLEANGVYAEIVRPIGGGKNEYVTFAPREVAAGVYDTELKARDRVRLYSTVAPKVVGSVQGATGGGQGAPGAEAGVQGVQAVGGLASGGAGGAVQGTPGVAAGSAGGGGAQGVVPGSGGNQGVSGVEGGGTVSPDLGLFLEVVMVSGVVRYQGPYARTPSLKLSDVVTADQILEETNVEYAELTRLRGDGTEEYRTFSPKEVLEGRYDIELKAKDRIRFVAKAGFGGVGEKPNFDKFADVVRVEGQVARPEVYALRPGMKLSDIVTAEQVLLDTNMNYGEMVRLRVDGKNEYETFRPKEVLEGKYDIALGARDVIRLVKVGYVASAEDVERYKRLVTVEGPVTFGGTYAWVEGMKLSELLGLAKPKLEANGVYAEIVRPIGGGKNEYVTFAPREVAVGVYDTELKARDRVRLYSTVAPKVVGGVQGASGGGQGVPGAEAGVQGVQGGVTGAVAGGMAGGASGSGVVQGTPGVAAGSAGGGVAQGVVTGSGGNQGVSGVEGGGTVSPDLGLFLEVVMVSGVVRYQGPYARTPSLKLSDVVTADQILEETNVEYAELTRLRGDGTEEYRTFSPKEVLEGRYDIELKAKDRIRFVAKAGFGGVGEKPNFDKFADVVRVEGNVARPEVYALRPGMKLSDIVTAEQVLLDTNMNYGEMVRLRVDGKNEYETFRPKEVLEGKYDIALGARDVIRLVKVGYVASAEDVERYKRLVTVEGPVTFGGTYAWVEGMKLSELLGLAKPKLEANGVYAEIVRPIGGGKNEYVTFAPREVESGVYDTELKARDRVRLYSTVAPKVVGSVQGAAGGGQGAPGAEAGVQGVQGGVTGAVAGGMAGGASGSGAVQGVQGVVASTPAAAGNSGIETDLGFYLEVVYASGTIRYQGPYARTPTLMLSSVVTPDQILQDTNLDYAELTRRKADGGSEYITFSPREVLEKTYDIPLRAMDSIRFVPVKYLPEKIDFDKFGNAIAIQGAANFPGLYSFSAPKMLSEILTPEQLLSTTDMYYGEIERQQKSGRVDYLTFSPIAVLKGYQDIRIYPRDIIRFVPAGDTGQNHDFSKYPDTVLLKGSIRYPGRYAWYKGMKLSDIVHESDLLIDTETSYAEVRRSSMAGDSIISFAPGQVVAAQADVELRPRDTVVFYPKYAQRPISIAGEVAEPKIVPYYDQIELSSVLRSVTLSQDLTNLKAEIKKANGETTDVYLEDYLKRQPTAKILLSPGDAITIKALLPDEHLPAVVVRGEVKSPQTLAFTEGMRLSDALGAVGGYASTAYPKGLVLIRKSVAAAQQAQVDRLIAQYEAATAAGAALPTISSSSTSSSAFAVIANMHVDLAIQKAKLGTLKQLYKEGFGRIALDIPDSLEALKGSSSDIKLERDDLIYVPKVPTYVLISGEVSSQNVVLYKEGLTVRQAITESGWVLGEADLEHAYIIRASGKLDSTEGKGFLFFKPNILNYRLEPGDTVYVPTKSSKVSMTWAYLSAAFEIVGTILTTALTAKTLLGL